MVRILLRGWPVGGRQLMEFFLETLAEISRAGKTHFERYIGNTAGTGLQKLGRPFEPVRPYVLAGGFTGQGMYLPVQRSMTHVKPLTQPFHV